MPKIINALLFFCTLMICHASNAYDDYWQCTSHDGTNQQWLIKSIYSIAAVNKAIEACKKHSKTPRSCQLDKDKDCEGFYNGRSTRPSYQCVALDQNGKSWRNPAETDKDMAATTAMSMCGKQSDAPDSCYINMLSCRDLNH